MFFLRQLKKFNMLQKVMVEFYTAIIESILTSSITIWFAASTAKDKGRLQRIIRSAEKVIGCDLPSLLDLFHSRTSKRACKIIADPSHPGHHLFQRLPSGRRFRAIKTKTSRHLNSFFPTAVVLTNKPPASHWLWVCQFQFTIIYYYLIFCICLLFLFLLFCCYVMCFMSYAPTTKIISCICKYTWPLKEFWFWFWFWLAAYAKRVHEQCIMLDQLSDSARNNDDKAKL